ncbi:uncharacterized protein BROUX77_007454 [Berkeleyomyces rouxiae]|uniref:uncharacterized protein n=1 Tax=Berkeleyomyces rouxiae TaxID=2035830 RepID=UPI003B763101
MSRRLTRNRPADAMLASGAAIKDDLPPLPTRFTSTYGAQINYAIYNPLKGRRRDLQTAIDVALRNQDDDAESVNSELMEQFMQETPDARQSRRETALRQRKAKAELEAMTPSYSPLASRDPKNSDQEHDASALSPAGFTRRKRVVPARRRQEDAQQESFLEHAQITGLEDPQSDSDMDLAQNSRDHLSPDQTSTSYDIAPRPSSPANFSKDDLDAVEGETVCGTDEEDLANQINQVERHSPQSRRPAPSLDKRSDMSDSSFNREGGIYSLASFTTMVNKTVVGSAHLFIKATLVVMVLVFWVTSWNWVSAHYTTNPTLKDWDFVWDSSNGIMDNLEQFIPLVRVEPILYLAHGNDSSLEENATIFKSFREQLKLQKKKLEILEKSNSLNTNTREWLEQKLPDLVVVERGGDTLRLPANLYHGIRDSLIKDGVFFNMGKTRGGKFEISSTRQWDAVIQGLEEHGYAKKTDIATLESGITDKAWRDFHRENDRRLSELSGKIDALGKPGNAASHSVITRAQLIEEMDREFSRTKNLMRKEIEALEERLMKNLEKAIKSASAASSAAHMTHAQVKILVSKMISQATTEGQLSALSSHEIRSDYNSTLSNQVNYFTVGAGASVVPHLSSPFFRNKDAMRNKQIGGSSKWKGDTVSSIEPATVLSGWADDGECWCGAIGITKNGLRQGTTVSIQLSHMIVPQYFVLEHVVKGATLDEEARPRDIELWAYIEDLGVRKRVQEFAETHLPVFHDDQGRPVGKPFSIDGFAKIGAFTFPASEHSREYVQQLPQELADLGVETDNIRVVAVTNYGDKDKTCIYRVRMYGARLGISGN